MELPHGGGISRYFEQDAPDDVRDAIKTARKSDILNPDFPYDTRWKRSSYEEALEKLQIELVRMQAWAKDTGQRIAIVFEGRDAAGKGGTIKRIRENLNPRNTKVVALSKPTETEAAQWYFQRYIAHLPAKGEVTIFDRSWYNRGVVEHVFGFCTPQQRERWFSQTPEFESMLVDEGITLIKIWLNVGRATQLKRFLDREKDPLKQWKLSWIDVEGLAKWGPYTDAIGETLRRTDTPAAPWTVVRSDDKRRARVQVISKILHQLDYTHKNPAALAAIDTHVAGGIDLWHA
ncbi:polyphosphate kinase 2 [Yoonia sediminilitoris]|uniref:ADP/GDP-polyphosphate phosphotransferase n=1 Tax=Yoonia sediminilitoris TaxID=1286148 RepID=A0A2T6KCQ3_9RHOB|nr:polyphosphate kinase 2 [Yoonia sediminilitoris]PUB12739.1 polyphosphate kinase 2 [Yoonia sediminilitoris]RCW94218.1 polyphosphate kinase 2 [Yoonia sediminilitoris]